MQKLFVAVLGNRNSGKSSTWNALFGSVVRTGKYARHLALNGNKCCEVFLISGSPEEREMYAGDILVDQECRIVLCSIQYTTSVNKTLQFVQENGFDLFVQWLNPGYSDSGENFDRLGLTQWLLANQSTLSMRDGRVANYTRSEEIREFIQGWAEAQKLTFDC